jgi:YidC/Oxa1 family membrane protein insertase
MPIFIALFMMLRSSIELRGASWLWIRDLSGPDALFHLPALEEIPLLGGFLGPSVNLLPVLMAVTQWLTMRLAPTRIDDPAQRTMMNLMPIMLTVFLYRAPSGLMIYWVAGNVWQMGHQHLTTRWVQRHTEEKPEPSPTPGKALAKDSKKRPGSTKSFAAAALAERRRDAAKARQRLVSESSSLPRWVRRGGG